MSAPAISPEFVAEAIAIDDAREAAYAGLRAANAGDLSGADVDAFEAAMDVVKDRCEQLRRRYFPHRHRLAITSGAALTISKTGGRYEIVWKRDRP